MRAQDILNYLQAEPFRPFRIHLASGRTCDIRHPENVKVGQSSVIVFTLVSDDPAIYDRWETVSLVLVERLEHVDSPSAA